MYEGMMKIYKENPSIFPMSVSYLLDKGFTFVQKITDKDVEKLEGNGLMTKEFVQSLVQTARDIAKECGNNVVEVIQFCMVEKIFDTSWYKYEEEELEEGEGMWV